MDGREHVGRPARGQPMSRRRLLATGAAGLAAMGVGAVASACGVTEQTSPARSANQKSSPVPFSRSLVTRWDTDPWARGSYSALPAGADGSARRVLADATIAGSILLAGEYTATDYPSTVHGAYNSGRRAAGRVLAAVGSSAQVLVVGAGIAGLAAARDLQDAGCRVIVAEARDRLGGRIHTNYEWGVPLEFGAAWVHGVTGNPLVPLVAQAGLALVPTDFDDAQTHSYVSGAPSPGAEAAATELLDLVDQLAAGDLPAEQSVQDALAGAGWTPDSPDRRFAAATEIVQEYGLDIDRLGAQALGEGEDYQGGDSLVAGGFSKVPQLLAAGLDVRLGTTVQEISGRLDALTAVTSTGPLTMQAAVVAVPLPLLQANSPKLPEPPGEVVAALRSLTTGNLEKVFLEYPAPWWPTAQVLQVADSPAQRWTEFYDLAALVSRPVLVGFSGGSAATTRPPGDPACADEAADVLAGAYRT